MNKLYIYIAALVLAFGAGMITQWRFELAGKYSDLVDQVEANKKGQEGAETIVAGADDKKEEIAKVPNIEENAREKSDCAVPDGIFDSLQRTAAAANSAARGSD